MTATKLKVPSGPDGLAEILNDHRRVKDYFSPEAVADGTTRDFMDAYAAEWVKKNPSQNADLRDQVQSVMFDLLRENGAGKKTAVDIGNQVSFEGGKPRLNLSSNGTAAIAKGRGAVYNRSAAGAAFENAYRQDDRFGSIGEYCAAIREEARPSNLANRKELLQKLENVRSFQNSFGSEDPAAGGFLIPEIMRSELLQLALEDTIVRSRATVIPMSTLRVPIPTVDDTSHVSSLFGGVEFYWAEEGSSLTESQGKFSKIVLDAKKLTGFFKVPNELLADAPAFSGWFDSRIPAGLAWWEDVAFLTETGSGTPQGVINSPGAVAVTRNTGSEILYTDITSMYQRMLPQSLGSAVWIASHDTFQQLATMQLSTSNASPGIWLGGFASRDASDTPAMTIFGRPVIFSEKVGPLGSTGDLNFVDLSYYLIGDRQAVAVAASDQAFFQNDVTAYRIIERVDGRPWVQTPLTPHNNSSATVSPYVCLH